MNLLTRIPEAVWAGSARLLDWLLLFIERYLKICAVFYRLLDATFSQPMTYNQSLRLVYLIPKAVSGFAPQKRLWQIGQFIKVATTDLTLMHSSVTATWTTMEG